MTYHINAFNKRALTYDRNSNILSLTQHWPDAAASYISLIHLRDHLGSVRAVIDGDTGTVLEANDYYPFGKRIPAPATGALSVTVVRQAHQPVEATDPVEATVTSTSSATAAEVNIDATGGTKSKCKKTTFNNLTK